MSSVPPSDGRGTVLSIQRFSIRPFFRWYDLWIGAYWDRFNRVLYVCPLPMIGFKITFARNLVFSGEFWLHDSVHYDTIETDAYEE